MNKLPPYNGGKSGNGTYQQIINHIPPHRIYVAPFAGHCGVFQKIRRADISILNDKDPGVIERWKQFPPPGTMILQEDSLPKPGEKFQTSILPAVITIVGDYAGILSRFGDMGHTFIYADPPYPFYPLTSKKKQAYIFDWPDPDSHTEFLSKALTCTSAVMISSYENDLYNDMLKGWTTHRFNSMTRVGLKEEIIYYNYPKPNILHDFRYLGKDFRQRERIKLKVKRWRNKLKNLPEQERTAILSDIINNNKTAAATLVKM